VEQFRALDMERFEADEAPRIAIFVIFTSHRHARNGLEYVGVDDKPLMSLSGVALVTRRGFIGLI